jgi:hypothetical protein
VKSKSLLES